MDIIEGCLSRLFIWSETEIDSELTFFRDQAEHHKEPLIDLILRFMDDIDSKSAAILTHVSMMIAVLSISVAMLKLGKVANLIVMMEMALYVISSLGFLRCLSILSPLTLLNKEEYLSGSLREAAIRRVIYLKCRAVTIFVTIAFLLTVILDFVATIVN